MANSVALIETKPTRTDYSKYFDFDFDQFSLVDDPSIKKVLKKDVTIEFDPDAYEWVILVGSEPVKYFTKITSVTEYSGKVVQEKYLPLMSAAVLAFKPEARKLFEESVKSIHDYINGSKAVFNLKDANVRGITDTQEALDYLQEAIDYPDDDIAIDSETSSLYPRNGYILGISLSYKPDYGVYISTECFTEEVEEKFQELFNKKNVVFHNAKFDYKFFRYHFRWNFPRFDDTMLLHYLIDENPGTHGLKELALKYTKYGDYEADLKSWIESYCKTNKILKDDFSFEYIPFETIVPYASIDAIVTLLLKKKFKPAIEKNSKLLKVYDTILIPGCLMLMDIEDNGVPFDRKRLVTAQKLMDEEINLAIQELYKHDIIKVFETSQGKQFNPNSVKQLRSLLFDFLKLPPSKKTDKGENSTDAEVLESLADLHEIPKLILAIRQKAKIKNTYLDKIIPQLDMDSRLRTNFNIHGTTSGRLSSSGKLNMQQLPRDNPIVKGCIKARPGHKIVSMDLGTAEVYIAAALSKDPALCDVFVKGEDLHSSIAKRVFSLPGPVEKVKETFFEKRSAAKAITFGILYGAGANKISSEISKTTGVRMAREEANELISDYFTTFKKLKKWIDDSKKEILTNKFIYSALGRKRRLPNVGEDSSGNELRSGLNFVVQSVASDVNLLAAIEMQKYIKVHNMKAKIFALVHDSILAEVPEDEVQKYCDALKAAVQRDRGVSIPGVAIGCDIEVDDDYSMGKYTKMYDKNV